MYRVLPIAAAVALAGCGSREQAPVAQPAAASISRPSARDTAQCLADLRADNVAYRLLPDRDFGNGCGLAGAVQLVEIGVPVTGVTAMRCGEARAFSAWVRNAVAPAAYQMLGSELASVQGMGSYVCRNVVGTAGYGDRRSGHAIANAVDFGGVTLKDGRRITILQDWTSPDPQVQGFLTTIHRSACRRFGTVLSPAYNAAHRNHLHLENDGAHFCR
ncbi:extensin family protein [Sphingomonas sp. XXL09]|uniref:extensin family protein n=1 Tax=Sphingomonas sp. XXL09 TaxID=3457787 RepID=UPI00406BD238